MSIFERFTTRNVGTLDRIVRVLPAILVAYLWFIGALSGTVLIVAVVLAAMMLATAVTARCSIYALLGVTTCARRQSQEGSRS